MKTILVTGATGVIGSALVPRLLADADTQVRLLIRAQGDEHIAARLTELRAFWDGDVSDKQFARIAARRGDVCEPQLGLNAAVYSRLAAEVTHVVHAAGNVKLNLSLAEARRYAVGGLQNVVAFCHAARRAGGFQKLDYVSTVGVAGRMPGLIPERRLTEPRAFHNSYEQGKAEAEEYLFTEMDQGLAATIHRPSMVVADSQTGKILHRQVFHYLCEFLSGTQTYGIVPDLKGKHLDIVPIDYVVDLITHSVMRPNAAGRVFHLCSGADGPFDLAEFGDRVHRNLARTNRAVPTRRTIPLQCFRAMVQIGRFLTPPGQLRKALGRLPPLLAYLDERQWFATAETARFARSHEIALPDPEAYVETMLRPQLEGLNKETRFTQGLREPTLNNSNTPVEKRTALR